MTRAKITKKWKIPVLQFIKTLGKDEEGNETNPGVDVEDAYLVKLLCDQIEKGEDNIFKILKHHTKQKEKRASE